MHNKGRFPNVMFGASLRPESAALAIVVMLLFLIFVFLSLTAQPAQGQTYRVIHNFTGGADGAGPFVGIMIDVSGNLYGTTWGGGEGYGVVFEMSRKSSNWVLTPLYAFEGGNDGMFPYAGVISDASGALYGTTSRGGSSQWGTVFKLSPSPATAVSIAAPWTESILFNFTLGSDGGFPNDAVVFDQAGNLYGTTYFGGNRDGYYCTTYGCGTVFKLAPSSGGWTESVLHSFTGGNDGGYPFAGVVFDQVGNLYGTSIGTGCGNVFQLAPSGSGWTETVLYNFSSGDGCEPAAGVALDQAGNLYGATLFGGFDWHGTVFELSPSNGNWNFSLLYRFVEDTGGGVGPSDCTSVNPKGPISSLTLDSAGELYGTTQGEGDYGWATFLNSHLTLAAGATPHSTTLLASLTAGLLAVE